MIIYLHWFPGHGQKEKLLIYMYVQLLLVWKSVVIHTIDAVLEVMNLSNKYVYINLVQIFYFLHIKLAHL